MHIMSVAHPVFKTYNYNIIPVSTLLYVVTVCIYCMLATWGGLLHALRANSHVILAIFTLTSGTFF